MFSGTGLERGTNMNDQIITVKLRLRDCHAAELKRQAREVNYIWNYLNETSRKAWKRDHRWLSCFDFQKLTAGASQELDIHAHTIQGVCKQFTISRDRARRSGLRWRGRKSLGWIPFNTGHVKFDGKILKFRGVRYQPTHLNPRLFAGVKIGIGSFNQDSRGKWYINLSVKIECSEGRLNTKVGIDLGLKELATLSDGRKVEMPRFYRASEQALGTAQRARKTKRARAIHAKVANRRKDFLHKASTALAKEYGLVVVGDVSPSKLAQTRMAKSVLDAGWSDFKRMLSYKALMHGGEMIEVSERMTTQTCSCCGPLPDGRPKGIAGLGIREWRCDDCGTVHDRDVNAAKNILRLGLETLAEGAAI
jgi:IS605 OrfB family transposase